MASAGGSEVLKADDAGTSDPDGAQDVLIHRETAAEEAEHCSEPDDGAT